MGTYYLFSPFLRRILLPNVKAELSCCSCYFIHKQGMCSIDLDQEDRHSSVLLICLISEHPNSIFSMVMTQLKFWIHGLASVKSFWVILKSFCDTFRLLLLHFLFPQLLKLRLDSSWTLSFYPVWLLIYFIFSTFLALRATSWIISPVLAFNSQSISFRGMWLLSNVSTEFLNFCFISLFSRSSVLFLYNPAYPLLIF